MTTQNELAYAANSLPKYIVDGVDYLPKIYGRDELKLPAMQKLKNTKLINWMIDVEMLFVATNKRLTDDTVAFYADEMNVSVNVMTAWSRRTAIKDQFEQNRREFRAMIEEQSQHKKYFDSLPPRPFSTFTPTKTVFTMTLQLSPEGKQKLQQNTSKSISNSDISLDKIFASVRISNICPFVYYKNTTKLHQKITPALEWENEKTAQPMAIYARIDENVHHPSNGLSYLEKQFDTVYYEQNRFPIKWDYYRFNRFLIGFNEDDPENGFVITAWHNSGVKKITRNELINRILKSITIDTTQLFIVKNMTESNVNGIVLFPLVYVDRQVWKDIMLNNPAVRKDNAIDEFKAKKDVATELTTIGCKISLTNKISDKPDILANMELEIGEMYIQCRLSRCQNRQVVDEAIMWTAKAITLYYNEYDKVAKWYQQFVPSFSAKPIKLPYKNPNRTLRQIAPEIFPENYVRHCLTPPRIVSDNEKKELEKKGYEVMTFPIRGESIPRHYSCDKQKKNKYISLNVNTLRNSDTFPFIPCCYVNSRKEKPNTGYRAYFYGEPIREKKSTSAELFLTNKMVIVPSVGILPPLIESLFILGDQDRDFMYVRRGNSNHAGPDSVFGAIGQMLNRKLIPHAERKAMAKERYAMICKQYLPFMSTDEICKSMLTDPFLPSKFLPALEERYSINLFLFSYQSLHSGKQTHGGPGSMFVPETPNGCLFNSTSRDVGLLFEHWGSDADQLKLPHVETIARVPVGSVKLGPHDMIFDRDTEFVREIANARMEMVTSIVNEIPQPLIEWSLPENYMLIQQQLDGFSKARIFLMENIKTKEQATIISDPVPPLPIPEWHSSLYTESWPIPSQKFIRQFISDIGSGLIEENENFISFRCGKVKAQLICRHSQDYNLHFKQLQVVVKLLLLYLTREAAIIVSNIRNKPKVIGQDEIRLLREKCKIGPHRYNLENVTDIISNSSPVHGNGKLLVPNQETFDRLLYKINLFSQRHPEEFAKFKLYKIWPNFYVLSSDYDIMPGQVIVKTDLTKMIEGDQTCGEKESDCLRAPKIVMERLIRISNNLAYILKTPRLGNKLWTIVNVTQKQFEESNRLEFIKINDSDWMPADDSIDSTQLPNKIKLKESVDYCKLGPGRPKLEADEVSVLYAFGNQS